MQALLVNSFLVTMIFIMTTYVQTIVNKHNELSIKNLTVSSGIVFLSCIVGDFFMKQLSDVDIFAGILNSDGAINNAKAFTDAPKF